MANSYPTFNSLAWSLQVVAISSTIGTLSTWYYRARNVHVIPQFCNGLKNSTDVSFISNFLCEPLNSLTEFFYNSTENSTAMTTLDLVTHVNVVRTVDVVATSAACLADVVTIGPVISSPIHIVGKIEAVEKSIVHSFLSCSVAGYSIVTSAIGAFYLDTALEEEVHALHGTVQNCQENGCTREGKAIVINNGPNPSHSPIIYYGFETGFRTAIDNAIDILKNGVTANLFSLDNIAEWFKFSVIADLVAIDVNNTISQKQDLLDKLSSMPSSLGDVPQTLPLGVTTEYEKTEL
jgi:hypothetical protein